MDSTTEEYAQHDDVTFVGDEPKAGAPESVHRAASPAFADETKKPGEVTDEIGVTILDATEWLMESDEPTEAEVRPAVVRLNVAAPGEPKKLIEWQIVPLPAAEFRRFRQMAESRKSRRAAISLGDVNDERYHLLVVTAATVSPDLREIARKKGIADPAEVVKSRFRAKPGLITQVSGYVSDISGYDEADTELVERAAGNS